MTEWSRAKVTQLIDKLRDYPVLWHVRCTDGLNKSLKLMAIGDIARSLNVSVEEVTKKIHSLKVQFSREYCRVRREKRLTGRTYIPKWYGYELLQFLEDSNTRNRKNVASQGKEEYNDCTKSDDQSNVSINSVKEENAINTDDDDDNDGNDDNDKESKTMNIMKLEHSTEKEVPPPNICHDEFVSFGLYIASKLRSFNNPYLQALAKHNINKAIFNIELKQLQQRLNPNEHSITLENYFQKHENQNLL